MSKKKHDNVVEMDRKSAAANDDMDPMASHDTEYVFDGPFDPEKAIEALLELNHTRQRCAVEWEEAKQDAANAKKALDDATNAITLLIDRIDRQQHGELEQPALKTLDGATEASV